MTSQRMLEISFAWEPHNERYARVQQFPLSLGNYDITQLMRYVHGPSKRFHNKDFGFGCWNPIVS